jgi:endoglucanase
MPLDSPALIKQLSELTAPSGHEGPVREFLRSRWAEWIDDFQSDGLGSLIAIKHGAGAEPRRRIMLSAHMDEIGLIVSHLQNGFIGTSTLGGIDYRALLGQPVLVHGRRLLKGLFGAAPPHMARSRDKYPEADEMWVDVGLPAEEVESVVQVGDLVTFDSPPFELKNKRFAGKSLDNRASLVALTVCLDELSRLSHSWDVVAVASAQEEVGSFGALAAANQIHPDVAVALDVTFATQPGVGEDEGFALGSGPTLAVGPNFHPRLVKIMRDVATSLEMKLPIEPMPGDSTTDAWVIQVSRAGVPSLLLSIPVRSMHSPVEVVDMRDVTRTGRLLAAFISGLGPDFLEEITFPAGKDQQQ